MSESKQTPGPWVHDGHGRIFGAKGPTIATIYGCGWTTTGHPNAKLIAAAPELLEAAKALLGAQDKGLNLNEENEFDINKAGFALYTTLREAVNKAEGK